MQPSTPLAARRWRGIIRPHTSYIRRIEMRAGASAEQQVGENERVLRELGEALRTSPSELPARVAALQAEVKRLEKEAGTLHQKLAAGGSAQLEETEVDGVRLMLQ